MPSAPTNGPLRVAREKPDPGLSEAGVGTEAGAGARLAGLESKGPQGSEVNVARLRVLQLRPSCQSAAAAAAASPPTLINRCAGVRQRPLPRVHHAGRAVLLCPCASGGDPSGPGRCRSKDSARRLPSAACCLT